MTTPVSRDSNFDPFLLEIIRSGFDAIADDMALTLMRTSYSGIIRDSMDFSTAVCDAEGQTWAQGLTTPMHLGSFFDAMQTLIRRYGDQIYEDDVFVANDPYLAAGQHLPDIYIIQPVFVGGQLSAWATTVAHHSDVGGIVAGSNALGAREIHQEGLRPAFPQVRRARHAQSDCMGHRRSECSDAGQGDWRFAGADGGLRHC